MRAYLNTTHQWFVSPLSKFNAGAGVRLATSSLDRMRLVMQYGLTTNRCQRIKAASVNYVTPKTGGGGNRRALLHD